MMSYLEKFRAMVVEIESHPLLEVVDFCVNQPAMDEELAAVETMLGASLAEPIRNFYKEANGLKLYWKIKSGMTDKELDTIQEEYDDYDIGVPDEEEDTDNENPFAKINFIPIENAIIHRNWHNKIIFDGITSDEDTVEFACNTYKEKDFQRNLKPFDLFSDYSCMAFFLEEGVGNPKVLRLSSHYAEWENSKITDFESYLEMLLVTKGIVKARKEIYNEYKGNMKDPIIRNSDYWTSELVPKLFRS